MSHKHGDPTGFELPLYWIGLHDLRKMNTVVKNDTHSCIQARCISCVLKLNHVPGQTGGDHLISQTVMHAALHHAAEASIETRKISYSKSTCPH